MLISTKPSPRQEATEGNSAAVVLDHITKQFGRVVAVDDLSLEVSQGEILSLLGPSGCGKTTTLRIVAGLDQPSSGEVRIGGRSVTTVPSHRRNLGLVPQSYALFPHLSVFDNIAFGLRRRGVAKADIAQRVRRAMDLVRLAGADDRLPHQLSGGQQQRVALARAIVIEPTVLLLDEPLGALDRKLRQEMQVELKQLQDRVGLTTMFVTHDQEEALTLSDRVAVMNEGRILQIGSPESIYEEPASHFVADFLGGSNFLAGKVTALEPEVVVVETGAGQCLTPRKGGSYHLGQPVELSIRPEKVTLSKTKPEAPNHLGGVVESVVYQGTSTQYYLRLTNRALLLAYVQNNEPPRFGRGDSIWCAWAVHATVLFLAPDAEGAKRPGLDQT